MTEPDLAWWEEFIRAGMEADPEDRDVQFKGRRALAAIARLRALRAGWSEPWPGSVTKAH